MSDNPYQVSLSQTEKLEISDFAWTGSSSLFSFEGRISRLPYFLTSFGVTIGTWILAVLCLVMIEYLGLIMIIFLLGLTVAIIWISFALSVKRLHDMDKEGIFVLVLFIPFVSFFFQLYLLFGPGTDGPNRYGDPPNWAAMGYVPGAGGYMANNAVPMDPLENWAAEAKANPDRIESWEWYFQEAYSKNNSKHILAAGKPLIRLYLSLGYNQEAYARWSDLRAYNYRMGDKLMLQLATDLERENPQASAELLAVMVEEGAPQDQLAPVCRLASRVAPEIAIKLLDTFLELAMLSVAEKEELTQLRHQLKGSSQPEDPYALKPEPTTSNQDPFGGSHGMDAFGAPALPANLQVREMVIKSLQKTGVVIGIGSKERNIRYASINAIALGVIKQQGSKPFLVVDLVLPPGKSGELRVLRATTKTFNPIKVMPDAGDPKSALLAMLDHICRESAATALPSLAALKGAPFATFDSLDAMSADVYQDYC